MCGRGDQSLTWGDICELSGIIGAKPGTNLEPRYNVAPTTTVHIVREVDGKRRIEKARWDLVPSWWKQPLSEKKFSTHNAKAETITEKATFRTPWKRSQRCIIPMNFFEWRRPRKKGDPPYHIFPTKEPAFRIAGLWDEWKDRETGEVILSCTAITCEPNDFMSSLHDRMPVILGADQLDDWFQAPPEIAHDMLKPCPSDWMTANRVSAYVNNSRNQGPECVEPDED
ncbi:MAG: SOS response-associated peptidase [Ahrensia sp.]|nr:SOS response-associated peptidase [Ahrensia sp.]